MTVLQYGFLAALSGALAAVAVFSAQMVRGALRRRSSALTDSWFARLGTATRGRDQAWAFLAHRISGVAILAFLAVHVLDVSLYALSPRAFDEAHELYGSAGVRIIECLLLYGILFHAFNGLRLLLLDVTGLGARAADRLLHAATAASLVLGTAGSAVIVQPLIA